ncbi:RNA polymerase epsilon subunit [Sinobaca sp. H24]
MYIEADSEMDVRIKLKDRPYNIEFVQPVSDALLAFEKQKEDFKVENI